MNTFANFEDDNLAVTYQVLPEAKRFERYSRKIRQSKLEQARLVAWLEDTSDLTDAQVARAFKVAWKSK